MFLTLSLLALQAGAPPAGPASDSRLACAPVQNMTAAGPPPAVFHAQRMEIAPESRVSLSVHRCSRRSGDGGGYRVERQLAGPGGADRGELEWVPVSQCPLLGAWVQAATRLSLPAPMLRPHASPPSPLRGTWFTLHAGPTSGLGSIMSMEMEILEPPGAAPNALSAWVRDGEQRFKACRDQGHGGTGYAPRPGRPG